MLKKAGFVAATAAGLMMVGGTAFSATADEAPAAPAPAPSHSDDPTFGDAYQDFKLGGAAAGYGASSLVGSAYTGIALTPSLVADSVS